MNGEMPPKFVSDRPYRDPARAMARILELANAAASDADKGRISIGPINRTLLDEGASVPEYLAGLERAVGEGWLAWHQCHAYVLLTPKGAERFA